VVVVGGDSTGFCQGSASNCARCTGTFDPSGAGRTCGGGAFLQQPSESDSPHAIRKHRFLASSLVQVDACVRSDVHMEEIRPV